MPPAVGIGDLFKAGVIPGLIMGAGLIATALILGRKANLVKLPKASWHDRWVAFKKAFWGLLMPVIILGGIYGGIFTPTEAAAVSVVYGLVVGVFVYKTVRFKELKAIIIDSASTSATVLFITATASMFSYVLTRSRLGPRHLRRPHRPHRGSTIIFFIIVNILLLIAGCFLDSTSALYIFTRSSSRSPRPSASTLSTSASS